MEGSERSRPGAGSGATGRRQLSLEALLVAVGGALPDRRAMSPTDASVTIPANPSLAADVLADTLEEALTEDGPREPPEDSSG
ncbi:MAG TPA: hypothetical protein VGV57_08095 [Thermoleophilaceae bacterium]|nr:hypothetical protein [Thermoleophilaceae bacterium]